MFALGSCLSSAAAACACSCCTTVTQQAIRSSARAGWSLLFTFSVLTAWIARDFGSSLLKKLPCEAGRAPAFAAAACAVRRCRSLKHALFTSPPQRARRLSLSAGIMRHFAGGDMPPDAWFGQQAVYRISLGNFVSPAGSTLHTAPASSCLARDVTHGDPSWLRNLGRSFVVPLPSRICICTILFSSLPLLMTSQLPPRPASTPLSPPHQVLFGSLAVVMLDVRYKSDKRDAGLHHGHWLLKAGLWLACNVLPFFLPVGVVGAYSWLARFGSPLFLLIQMVILLVGAARRAPAGLPACSSGWDPAGMSW